VIIYHGSTIPVVIPEIRESERMLDFGKGFYTTSNKEQAERWSQRVAAKRSTKQKIISEYEFDFEAARKEHVFVVFEKPDNHWFEFVCQNRSGKIPSEVFDIAMGPVANDLVYATVILYEQGLLSKEAAISELKVRKLYDQILFHTEKSLAYCQYLRHYTIGENSNG